MRRLMVLLVLVFVVVPVPQASADAGCSAGDLTLSSQSVLSDRLHELVLQSDAMRGETRVRVLLPSGYADRADAYPVLYLLHGAGDDHTTWTENTDVEEATSSLDLIVVMPDGGKNENAGWYSDWHDGSFCWESYHIGELVGFVDSRYRTVDSREGRALAGLSMGGFGAMSYAARHPDLFVAAESFSGAVDTADGSLAEAAAFEALNPYFGTPDHRVWGDYASNEVEWRNHNPTDLSMNLRWTGLSLVTGNGAPLPGDNPPSGGAEAGVYTMNRLFHHDLELEEIDHRFHDRGYGTHEWHYWQADLHDALPRLLATFADPPEPPDAFDYRTADASFDVWGWTFAVERPAKEFLDLTYVSERGFSVRGSGALDVVTSAAYAAGGAYRVSVEARHGSGGTADSFLVTADAEGRLALSVDLGPGHAQQQYTPEGRVAETLGTVSGGYYATATVRIVEAL